MKVNWPERWYCNSFVRRLFQRKETLFWRAARPMPPGGACLEIGSGNGAGAALIAEMFAPAKLWCLDLDPAMIAAAVRRQAKRGPRQAVFMEGDAQDLPFPDGSMDAVFNFGIVHHLEDWRRGIAEVARVLRPGGAFYFEEIFEALYANPILRHVVLHPTKDRFQGDQWRAALAGCGLELLPGYHESRRTTLGVAVKPPGLGVAAKPLDPGAAAPHLGDDELGGRSA